MTAPMTGSSTQMQFPQNQNQPSYPQQMTPMSAGFEAFQLRKPSLKTLIGSAFPSRTNSPIHSPIKRDELQSPTLFEGEGNHEQQEMDIKMETQDVEMIDDDEVRRKSSGMTALLGLLGQTA
jgi:hypothetical protein